MATRSGQMNLPRATTPGPAPRSPRRAALKMLAGAATAVGLGGRWTRVSRGKPPARPGPNDTIGVAAIGVGNRARLLLEQLPDGARIVALADCNLPRAESFKAAKRGAWDVVQDYRRLLDRADIDAVIVATGDFQRVLPCIHACLAGKDIYAEKPLTHSIAEGRALVRAVRNEGRVFQVGTQQRSMAINRVACEFVRSGGLGKLLEVRARNYTGPLVPPPEGFPAQPVPAGLDWNMWLNQAAERPYSEQWMSWMFWRDFSGGEMTNWGAHGVDQIQWALGADASGPVEVWPLSPGPNGQVAMRYASGVEVHFVLEPRRGPQGGAVFVGERGKLEINRNKIVSNPPEIAASLLAQLDAAEEERKWSDQTALWQARWHLENWLDCLRTRALPVADVEIGHRSVTACHLANLARRLGRRLTWDPAREVCVGDAEAQSLVDPPRRKGYELPA